MRKPFSLQTRPENHTKEKKFHDEQIKSDYETSYEKLDMKKYYMHRK
jgi:hypothetical protein